MSSEDHLMWPPNLFCYVQVCGTDFTQLHCPPSMMVGWFRDGVLISQWEESGGAPQVLGHLHMDLFCQVWVGLHLSRCQSGKGAWTSGTWLDEVPEAAV